MFISFKDKSNLIVNLNKIDYIWKETTKSITIRLNANKFFCVYDSESLRDEDFLRIQKELLGLELDSRQEI